MAKQITKLTESEFKSLVSNVIAQTLQEAKKKTKDPMAQWFDDINKASKYRETMDYIEKGGRNPNKRSNSDTKQLKEEDERFSSINSLYDTITSHCYMIQRAIQETMRSATKEEKLILRDVDAYTKDIIHLIEDPANATNNGIAKGDDFSQY